MISTDDFQGVYFIRNKKTFQLNANCPLADSMGYIGNKFEHFPAWSLYSEVQVEHVLTCLGAGPCTGSWGPIQAPSVNRRTDGHTQLRTLSLPLSWWVTINGTVLAFFLS